jgi:hypothetical protein
MTTVGHGAGVCTQSPQALDFLDARNSAGRLDSVHDFSLGLKFWKEAIDRLAMPSSSVCPGQGFVSLDLTMV